MEGSGGVLLHMTAQPPQICPKFWSHILELPDQAIQIPFKVVWALHDQTQYKEGDIGKCWVLNSGPRIFLV